MTPSKTPFLLVIVTITATLPLIRSTPNPVFLDYYCLERSGSYTPNSTFHHNLSQLLSNLQANSSTSSSYETTSSNLVTGRYYCRHDLSLDICTSCVKAAAKQIVSNCSSSREAIVWYEECTLLYHNYSAKVDYNSVVPAPYLVWYMPHHNATNPSMFSSAVATTMERIINESAYGPIGFATGEGSVTAVETVYCLGQCSPFISGLACEKCLRKGLNLVDNCCKGFAELDYFGVNCQFRYSTVPSFYDFVPSSAPSPAEAPPPPVVIVPSSAVNVSSTPSTTPSGNGEVTKSCRGSCKLWVVIAAVSTLVSLLWSS